MQRASALMQPRNLPNRDTADPGADPDSVHWVTGVAGAIAALGGPGFWDVLIAGIGALVEHQGAVVFRYRAHNEPDFLFGDFRNQVSRGDFREYRKRAYLLDPFYLAYLDRQPDGVHMLRDLAADRFFFSEYCRTYYVQTGLADEVGIFCRLADDDLVIVSLVRRKGTSGLSAKGIRALRLLSPLFTSLVRRHLEQAESLLGKPRPATSGPPAARLHFGGDDKLTQREAAIADLILRGHSSPSMALLLGISVETVKVHRRHIYTKLRISSQAELFSRAMSRSAAGDRR
ncbi:helix-turn-helix transcriptional regulator [Albidovulum sp.]|uniref:helix-turn-helix transcriptional regulator n=1 Tax=Albidovulum sp. TaxID=1872424 RepID=UPI0039B8518C